MKEKQRKAFLRRLDDVWFEAMLKECPKNNRLRFLTQVASFASLRSGFPQTEPTRNPDWALYTLMQDATVNYEWNESDIPYMWLEISKHIISYTERVVLKR